MGACRGQRHQILLELQTIVNWLIWLLRTKLGFFAGAENTFNYWAFSQAAALHLLIEELRLFICRVIIKRRWINLVILFDVFLVGSDRVCYFLSPLFTLGVCWFWVGHDWLFSNSHLVFKSTPLIHFFLSWTLVFVTIFLLSVECL